MNDEPTPMAIDNWHVFETIVADGSWAVGIAQGTPNPDLVMVIADRLSQTNAIRIAQQQARERSVGSSAPCLDSGRE